MDPMMIAGLATQGVKMLAGGVQAIAGGIMLKKAQRNRPGYDIPKEFQDAMTIADKVSMMGMPREQYVAQLQGITRNQGFGLRALGDRRSALAGVGNLVQSGNDAMLRLNATDAGMRRDSQMRGAAMKTSAKYQMGMQKLAKQQWDKFNPYLGKVAQAQGLIGAGMQNLTGGADAASSMFMNSPQSSSAAPAPGGATGGSSDWTKWLNQTEPWMGG
jgi:hypothetical protein